MREIEERFKDPESKNKLKTIKVEAEKQIQWTKFILEDLINQSFLRSSRCSVGEAQEDQLGRYIEGGDFPHNQNSVERGSLIPG
jgi:hypothetical protein